MPPNLEDDTFVWGTKLLHGYFWGFKFPPCFFLQGMKSSARLTGTTPVATAINRWNFSLHANGKSDFISRVPQPTGYTKVRPDEAKVTFLIRSFGRETTKKTLNHGLGAVVSGLALTEDSESKV